MEKHIQCLASILHSHSLSIIPKQRGTGADGRTRTENIAIYHGTTIVGTMSYDPSTKKVTSNITYPYLQYHQKEISAALQAVGNAYELCNIVHAGSQYY